MFKQKLHPKTHTQHRLAQPPDTIDKPVLVQLPHRSCRHADAGENHLVGTLDFGVVSGQMRRLTASFKRESHRGNIRPATVNDCDHLSVPARLA
jgi:hypothetical protein